MVDYYNNITDKENQMPEAVSELKALKTYFGYKPGDGLKEFSAELRALTAEEKTELAVGAAKNLGVTLIGK